MANFAPSAKHSDKYVSNWSFSMSKIWLELSVKQILLLRYPFAAYKSPRDICYTVRYVEHDVITKPEAHSVSQSRQWRPTGDYGQHAQKIAEGWSAVFEI